MDGFTLVLWGVRLLFLLLLYLFLARVIRVLLRDLRAAAREPGQRPGRLVVLESPGGRTRRRPLVRARRHHHARARRQQRDRHRRPVRVGRACRADLSRPELVPRGPRQHERFVRQRPPDRWRGGARLRRRGPDRPGPDAPGADVVVAVRAPAAVGPEPARDPRADPAARPLAGAPPARAGRHGAGRREPVAGGDRDRPVRAVRHARPRRSTWAPCWSPIWPRCWPDDGRTRCCCRRSRCSAASRSC